MQRTVHFDQAIETIKEELREISPTKKIILLGLAGGSASGKSTLAKNLEEHFPLMLNLSLDHYYLGKHDMPDRKNYDHPHSLELSLLEKHLALLHQGQSIQRPDYRFALSQRVGYQTVLPASLVLVEGLFALHETLRPHIDYSIFVDASRHCRLERRMHRDIAEGRRMVGEEGETTVREKIRGYWERYVEPMYQEHVAPTKAYADLIVVNE